MENPVNFFLLALFAMLSLGVVAPRAAETSTNAAATPVQLPFEFRHDNLIVSARVNDSKPLSFKLDTGFSITTIHPDLVESLQLKRAGTLTIVGIAGKEEATMYWGAEFDFGGVKYAPRRVAVIPSDAQKRRRGRDGIIGASFFRRFVVEMNPKNVTLTLHDPKAFEYSGNGEILPLEFRRETPIVEAQINFTNREPVRAKFEIDSGCDGELCLGHDFVEANKLDGDPKSGSTGSRFGVGGSVDTRYGVLPQFQLGKLKLDSLSANFFMVGSPVDAGLAGHIGLGTLRKFKVIFDYSRRRLILEPLK